MVVNTLGLGKGSNTSLQMETEQFPSKPMTSSLIEGYRVRSLGSTSRFSAGRLIWLPAALCTSVLHQGAAVLWDSSHKSVLQGPLLATSKDFYSLLTFKG